MQESDLRPRDVLTAKDTRARDLLAEACLRPSRQRLALTEHLFAAGGRHVSASDLHDELVRKGAPVSLCCVYSTLRRFSEIGLIRRVPVYGATAYFDTDTSHHHHFYVANEDRLIDLPNGAINIRNIPDVPEGYDLISIDVVLRLKSSRQPPP